MVLLPRDFLPIRVIPRVGSLVIIHNYFLAIVVSQSDMSCVCWTHDLSVWSLPMTVLYVRRDLGCLSTEVFYGSNIKTLVL